MDLRSTSTKPSTSTQRYETYRYKLHVETVLASGVRRNLNQKLQRYFESLSSYLLRKVVSTDTDLNSMIIHYDRRSEILCSSKIQGNQKFDVACPEWIINDISDYSLTFVEYSGSEQKSATEGDTFLADAARSYALQDNTAFTVFGKLHLHNRACEDRDCDDVLLRPPKKNIVIAGFEETADEIRSLESVLKASTMGKTEIIAFLLNGDNSDIPNFDEDACEVFFVSKRPLSKAERDDVTGLIGKSIFAKPAEDREIHELYILMAGGLIIQAGSAIERIGVNKSVWLTRSTKTLIFAFDICGGIVGYSSNTEKFPDDFLSGFRRIESDEIEESVLADLITLSLERSREQRGIVHETLLIFVPSTMSQQSNATIACTMDHVIKRTFIKTPEYLRPAVVVVTVQTTDNKCEEILKTIPQEVWSKIEEYKFSHYLHFGYVDQPAARELSVVLRSPSAPNYTQIRMISEDLSCVSDPRRLMIDMPLPLEHASSEARQGHLRLRNWLHSFGETEKELEIVEDTAEASDEDVEPQDGAVCSTPPSTGSM